MATPNPEPTHTQDAETLWRPADILSPALPALKSFAIVVLNQPMRLPTPIYTKIWSNAHTRIGADGGANRVHLLNSSKKEKPLELDTVIGDLDSLSPSVRRYWEDRGSTVIHDGDQYSTDFTKAVKHVQSLDRPRHTDIVVLGGLGGRVDQGLSVLHHLYLFQSHPGYASGRMYLLSSEAITFVLQPGKHRIKVKQRWREIGLGKHIGIIPMREPSVITTTGLEWDVEKWETAFGGQMSTSNHVRDEWVTVETSKSVLFTIDLDGFDIDLDRDASLG
jgi:thiamine pyrophosphokinase